MSIESQVSSFCHQLNSANIKYRLIIQYPDKIINCYASEQLLPGQLETLRSVFVGTTEPDTPSSSYAPETQEDVNEELLFRRALSSPTKDLNLSNDELVISHLRTCFTHLQQVECKSVAKAWIRLVEPKKQTNFPYKDGDRAKPRWWPESVRHVEPDHLKKNERITLLVEVLFNGRRTIADLYEASRGIRNIDEQKMKILNEVFFVMHYFHERCSNPMEAQSTLVVSDFDKSTTKSPASSTTSRHARNVSDTTRIVMSDIIASSPPRIHDESKIEPSLIHFGDLLQIKHEEDQTDTVSIVSPSSPKSTPHTTNNSLLISHNPSSSKDHDSDVYKIRL